MISDRWYRAAESLGSTGQPLAIVVSRADFFVGVAQLNAASKVAILDGPRLQLTINTPSGDLMVTSV